MISYKDVLQVCNRVEENRMYEPRLFWRATRVFHPAGLRKRVEIRGRSCDASCPLEECNFGPFDLGLILIFTFARATSLKGQLKKGSVVFVLRETEEREKSGEH